MKEYKIGNARVRMYGEPDKERIKAATEKFIKKVLKTEKELGKNIINKSKNRQK